MTALPKGIDWLLEEDNPPVRYLTLTRLLGRPPASAEVRRAKTRLMSYDVTRGIVERSGDFWGDDHTRAYSKYGGKYWQIIFLGQFLADGHDPSLADGIRATIAQRDWVTSSGGQCLTAGPNHGGGTQ